MGVRTLAALWVLLCAQVAIADSPAELQARGVELAKEGRYSEAIDAFKAADRVQPTASNVCMIALAYMRRELWPEAEIFLAQCKARASAADPLPAWFADEQTLLTQRLATANAAPVEIAVEPAGAHATLTISSFAPDEQFAPGTIHLAPGDHVIIANAPGYEQARRAIQIAGRSPVRVVIRLRRPGEGAPSPWPRRLMIGGGIVAGAGIVTYGVIGLAWFELRDAGDRGDRAKYDQWDAPYKATKYATWALWGVGAGLAITGYVLHRKHHEEVPDVAAAPLPGGGMIVVGWQR